MHDHKINPIHDVSTLWLQNLERTLNLLPILGSICTLPQFVVGQEKEQKKMESKLMKVVFQ